MDKDRSDKLDAAIAGLRDGYVMNTAPLPSDIAMAIYAASMIDGLESAGFKIEKPASA